MTEKSRGELLWEPSAEAVERSNLTRYTRWLEAERGLELPDYETLRRWSIDSLEDFWTSIWEFFEVRADGDPTTVLAHRSMPGARWFSDVRLNYAEHIFRDRGGDEVAVRHRAEGGELGEITWGELRDRVGAFAAGLRALGVERGDRVVAYLPNSPAALIGFLASASIGAVWSSCSPDFGVSTVVDRFAQIEPKVLLAVDGYRYNGRPFDRMEVVAELERSMPTVEHTVLVPYLDPDADASRLAGGLRWHEVEESGAGSELRFERVPFDHPLWVLYSSGTTGLPKAIVQGHGGILLEQLKKLNLHLDAQPGDRVFWFTTTGWMMWNFLVGVLLTEASIVLYDGSPAEPDMGVLWDLADEAGVTCFGTSASYIAACMKEGVEPGSGRDLSSLRSVGSTGSPLAPEGFQWVYDHVGADTWLFSTSGGTDVCTAFVGGVPTLPVYRGELQGRSLGAAVRGMERGRRVGDRRGRRAGDHRADAVDAGLLLGRSRRLALPRELLRDVPRDLAPRRLDRDHRSRARRSSTGARTRPSTAPGSAWAPRRSIARSPRSTRSPTRSWSTSRGPGPRAGCRCSSSSATTPSSTRR